MRVDELLININIISYAENESLKIKSYITKFTLDKI
jgi:hypothetical protein